jgi:hypothetical protein
MFGGATCIVGNDILDIGSRKAEGAKRARGLDMPPMEALMGNPGQFEVPNVSDVS